MNNDTNIIITTYSVLDPIKGETLIPLFECNRKSTIKKIEKSRKLLEKIWSSRFKRDVEVMFIYKEDKNEVM